jgi:hypothetical protein
MLEEESLTLLLLMRGVDESACSLTSSWSHTNCEGDCSTESLEGTNLESITIERVHWLEAKA